MDLSIGSSIPFQHENTVDRKLDKEKVHFMFLYRGPGFETFFQDFLSANVPCILSCGITDKWNASKEWVDAKGEPDLRHLCQKYGDIEVPVANCSEKYYDSQPKTQQKLGEYAAYMKEAEHHRCLYLKDWHLHWEQRRRHPTDPPFYRTPHLVSSDWLNEFWEERPERGDDYRFVYVGVAGTWTPFHADVYRSFSWSANVCGAKRWILLPPGEEEKLRSLSGLPFDVASVLGAESSDQAARSTKLRANGSGDDSGVSGGRGDEDAISLQPLTAPNGVRYFDVRQEAGEMIFVPSGWHHQVWNLRDTISINHNWFNASNVHLVGDHLLASLAAVRAELADIADDSDEFLAQCQTLLRATHGMDLCEFAELLCFTASRRLEALRSGGEPLFGLDGWQYGRKHMVYDVRCAGRELRKLLVQGEFSRLEDLQRWRLEAGRLLEEIDVQFGLIDGSTVDDEM